jgi:hypothetical protein
MWWKTSDDWRGGSALDGLTTSSNCSKKSFSQTAKVMLGSVSAKLGEGGGPPALQAAAADPRGSFTVAATEAGDVEETVETAGDACTSEGGAGVPEGEEAGEPGTATTRDKAGGECVHLKRRLLKESMNSLSPQQEIKEPEGPASSGPVGDEGEQ